MPSENTKNILIKMSGCERMRIIYRTKPQLATIVEITGYLEVKPLENNWNLVYFLI